MIAPPTDIRSAIRVYYGVGKDTASLSEAVAEVAAENAAGARSQRSSSPVPQGPSAEATPIPGTMHVVRPEDAPPVTVASVRPLPVQPSNPPGDAAGARPISEPPDSGPQIEAREISMPAPKKGGGRMVTLTLLDGTKVNLPARDSSTQQPAVKVPSLAPAASAANELTARDLIAALRAVSHGADATEILGNDVHWEALFSALLSLLLKKQLIADWEFVEEYKKV
jgi:hypothetical protein